MNDFIDKLLQKEVQQFIHKHRNDDEMVLVLKNKTIAGVPAAWLADQIVGRRKAEQKLPSWARASGIIYPGRLALEQCSSEATAVFKSSILRKLCKGNGPFNGLDLSSGFGVDDHYISQWAWLTRVEPDTRLLLINSHNQRQVGGIPSVYKNTDAESFLQESEDHFDFAFIDPSRRKTGEKVYRLDDCEPDVVRLLPLILEKSSFLLLKASPMLDIERACQQLQKVLQVWIVSVGNECKELLFHVHPKAGGETLRTAVELSQDGNPVWEFSFFPSEERSTRVLWAEPQEYIYDPPVALLKAGAFNWIASHWGLSKLAPDSHLYTSDRLLETFPGRIFRVVNHHKLDKKLSSLFEGGFVNVISRNYPLSVEQILRHTGLKEGGKDYLICTRAIKRKFVMRAARIFPDN
ncbi:MAG: hypothetical protein JST46_07405 [Bacteroidetes bacterium]|nr:hypothetical protein [Bacteroidota bacterium]